MATQQQHGLSNDIRFTGREFLYYLLFAVLGLFALLWLAIAFWYATPREPAVTTTLSLDDYPPADRPYQVVIVRYDATFWLVNQDGRLFAFAPNVPDVKLQCEYSWNSANERFEDPCLGSKFTLTGVYIEGPAIRNLDQHPIQIEDYAITVNVSDTTPGAPLPTE